ncbi:MAG TPA: zf-HC2 domain-containing protein, partial [Vampirovibrionales bacterium]
MPSNKIQFKDFETLSEYYDGESLKPSTIHTGIEANPHLQKVIDSFTIASRLLKSSFKIDNTSHDVSSDPDQFWEEVVSKIDEQESFLNKALESSLGQLPTELSEFDLWKNIEEKLDQEENSHEISSNNVVSLFNTAENKNKETSSSTYSLTESLKEVYKLPEDKENIDLWEAINEKLDSVYHAEMFSDSFDSSYSNKERFLIGLSEFVDGEVTAAKANTINEHLLQCSSCRKLYVSFCRQKQALKES